MHKKFSIADRIKSFRFAFRGISDLFRFEHNAVIHLLCTILAITLGLALDIQAQEWIAVILAISFVFASELINSAIERAVDLHSGAISEKARQAKDMSAAAVLLAAIAAFIIGGIIFIPKIYQKF